jgi:hypothetical protein
VREEDDGEDPPHPPPGDPPGEGEEDGEEKEGEGATAVKKPIHVKRKELLGSGKGSLGVQLVRASQTLKQEIKPVSVTKL